MFPRCVLVMLLCGGFCHATHIPLIETFEVEAGQSVLLPCNGSAYVGEEETAHWEVKGDDVAIMEGQEARVGEKFKGRVQLPSEEKLRQGNWSVVLDPVMSRDGDMYECIWKGVKVLSTVWLKVKIPDYLSSTVAYEGEGLSLPCFIQIPRSQSVSDLQIWWTRNGSTLVSVDLKDFSDVAVFNSDLQSLDVRQRSEEIYHLYLYLITVADSGEYRCLYKSGESDPPTAGIPESVSVTVLETRLSDPEDWLSAPYWTPLPETEEATEAETPLGLLFAELESSTYPITVLQTSTEDWVSTPHWTMLPVTEEATEAETPLDLPSVELESSMYPVKVTTESQPMEAFEETATSFPGEETSSESVQWDTLPWVRIGLISGVLAVTAVTLCILGALRKI